MTPSPLHVVVNWPVFAINFGWFISKFNYKGSSSPVIICLTLKWVTCAISWVMCAMLYFGSVSLYKISLSSCPNSITERFLNKYLCNHHKHFYMPPCWIFSFHNFKLLTVGRVNRVSVRPGAKFRGDQSNRWWNVATDFFRFFKTAAATVLDFYNFDFIPIKRLKRQEGRPASRCQISWR